MARIDFLFYGGQPSHDRCWVTENLSLEADKEEFERGEGALKVVHHLTLDSEQIGCEAVITLLLAAHRLQKHHPDGYYEVARLIDAVFMAGVEYGRKNVLMPLLERSKSGGL